MGWMLYISTQEQGGAPQPLPCSLLPDSETHQQQSAPGSPGSTLQHLTTIVTFAGLLSAETKCKPFHSPYNS